MSCNRSEYRLVLALSAIGFLAASGCQQLATYPPVEVTAKMQRPEAEPVPTICAESVKHVREHALQGQALPVNLPAHMPAIVYDRMFVHLNAMSGSTAAATDLNRPMIFPDEPAIHITEIRTRSMNAQVDMVYPSPSGFQQFVTLTLERGVFDGWRVKSERKWVMRDLKTPAPNYVADPVNEKTAKVAGAWN